eukprot:PLAT12510.2.p1 GENE.PLAT12510.2~~PLAT12510.2.p1  ORF type:complete len:1068 (-),score=676.99 PLAT12510.2:47-3250(-)
MLAGSALEAHDPVFLSNLSDLLSAKETNAVIRWREDGLAFCVANAAALSDVLPAYFGHESVAAFMSKLRELGFREDDASADGSRAFSHADFRRPADGGSGGGSSSGGGDSGGGKRADRWRGGGSSKEADGLAAARQPLVSTDDGSAVEKARRESSLLDEAELLQLATLYVKDGLHGRKINYRTDARSIYYYRIHRKTRYRLFIFSVAMLHMMLAVVEKTRTLGGEQFTAGLTWPLSVTGTIELACVAVYALDIWVQLQFLGWQQLKKDTWVPWKAGLSAFVVVDILTSWTRLSPFQFSRPIRPFFFIVNGRNLRGVLAAILHSLPELTIILVLMAFAIMLFAFFGHLVLTPANPTFSTLLTNSSAWDGGCSIYLKQRCENYFETIASSVYQMWMLAFKGNFPDVMMPFYRRSAWSALFFISFLLIAFLFMYRLLLAVTYDGYKKHFEARFATTMRRARFALLTAFHMLQRDGAIKLSTWVAVVRRWKPALPSEVAVLLFEAVDRQHVGVLGAEAFMELASMADVDAEREQQLHLATPWRRRLREIMEHTAMELFVDALVVLSVVRLLLVQDLYDIANDSLLPRVLLVVLLVLFGLEVVAKLLAYGWTAYWREPYNRLDFIVVFVSVLAELLVATTPLPKIGLQVVIIVRSIRFLRVFRLLKRLELITMTAAQLLPTLLRIVAMLLAVMYVFAMIGEEVWGGRMARGSSAALDSSSYGANNFYLFNFDDFGHSMVTLVVLLMVSKSVIIIEGAMAALRSTVSVIFFVLFWVAAIVLVMNVVIAFILESYRTRFAQNVRRAAGAKDRWLLMVADAQERLAAAPPETLKPYVSAIQHSPQPWLSSLRGIPEGSAVDSASLASDDGSCAASSHASEDDSVLARGDPGAVDSVSDGIRRHRLQRAGSQALRRGDQLTAISSSPFSGWKLHRRGRSSDIQMALFADRLQQLSGGTFRVVAETRRRATLGDEESGEAAMADELALLRDELAAKRLQLRLLHDTQQAELAALRASLEEERRRTASLEAQLQQLLLGPSVELRERRGSDSVLHDGDEESGAGDGALPAALRASKSM